MKDRVLSTFLLLLLMTAVLSNSFLFIPSEKKVKNIISSQISLIEESNIRVIYKKLSSPEEIVPVRCERVVPVTYTKVISLRDLQPSERKKKFIDLVLPSVLIVNYEVKHMRENLTKILKKLERKLKLSRAEVEYVERLLDRCRADSIEEALIKANPVPPSLVIAQAAIESGWGTSRFFVEGNNLFGMWTFKKTEDAIISKEGTALLRKYDSILDSVRGYIYTINVGWAYRGFRNHRLRNSDPIELSKFLSLYSIERYKYVEKIKRIIEENDLRKLDLCSLDPAYIR